ncbi:MAG: thioredoxin domain-containing protein, partial [Theionarchaea archaeon]|nr:thioredoxin domain-containing protein [Theionarchaea archaeon]
MANRLARERSPYLLQHSENPVDWYPWGSEAFERAKIEGKPVFLSIGYSTCHWCHVMAHESFEDDEIAGMMNDAFVSVKVDREERPDIDSLYMKACQATTGSGGWPLTIVMTPDGRPFFAGTYFPKISRLGLIGMRELIPRILEVWNDRREEVEISADRIVDSIKEFSGTGSGGELNEGDLDAAFHQLSRAYDDLHGGFGSSPKFPTPHNLAFLLRYWKRSGESHALDMVEKTLRSMRNGGIFDQLGLGFHRYSTDSVWLVPHFEKMLYDQALLALVYLEAFQVTGGEEYANTVREIFRYVLRDMKSPDGAFFSGEDADSEGEEGRFYIWKEDEIRSILDEKDADLFAGIFGITRGGNFEGSSILYMDKSIKEVARDLGVDPTELAERLEMAKERLLVARDERVRPFRDDKILTDWNSLMIAALARGSQTLDDDNYVR